MELHAVPRPLVHDDRQSRLLDGRPQRLPLRMVPRRTGVRDRRQHERAEPRVGDERDLGKCPFESSSGRRVPTAGCASSAARSAASTDAHPSQCARIAIRASGGRPRSRDEELSRVHRQRTTVDPELSPAVRGRDRRHGRRRPPSPHDEHRRCGSRRPSRRHEGAGQVRSGRRCVVAVVHAVRRIRPPAVSRRRIRRSATRARCREVPRSSRIGLPSPASASRVSAVG
jgi:hypothetical protein